MPGQARKNTWMSSGKRQTSLTGIGVIHQVDSIAPLMQIVKVKKEDIMSGLLKN